MKSRLDQLERAFKSIIEGDSSIFSWMDGESLLLHKLIESIQDCLLGMQYDSVELPGSFSIYLNAEDQRFLESQQDWHIAISKIILDLASELGFRIEKKPEINMITLESLSKSDVIVKATFEINESEQTNAVPLHGDPNSDGKASTHFAANLLLEDETLFPLQKPVTNIGRKSSNHLVINDLRISRTHAQIRAVAGGFIIFDIGSSGGTYVNGERVSQRKLRPGDVISLAGIKLIYTEEQTHFDEGQDQIIFETKPINTSGVA
ncbi:MAG: FHA domain-containing protein [Anaerolineaceae bacterium]